MKRIFDYIVAVYKKIIEAIKKPNMSKTIFENELNNKLTTFTSMNHAVVNHINFSTYNNGYDFTITFHNKNTATIRIFYNKSNQANDVLFNYIFQQNTPLLDNTTHNNYLDVLISLKNQIEPLYKKHVVAFYKLSYLN